jgi:hypothetical protein
VYGTGWTVPAAVLAAFGIAVTATPAGISGAVLLLPFQVSVLGTPSPAVTPTNLLYNLRTAAANFDAGSRSSTSPRSSHARWRRRARCDVLADAIGYSGIRACGGR